MSSSAERVGAARILLGEVVALIGEHRDDTVLVGGWVPSVIFPDARPPHVGSIDVDLAMRLQREGYARLVGLLEAKGFHRGENGYQFFKVLTINGIKVTARLDLLTSKQHHDDFFAGARPEEAPEAIRGAEIAFADNRLTPISDAGEIRVAGIVAFLVMKSLALHSRNNEKDAYDIHFCLERYPDGLEALAELFRSWRDEPLVHEALVKMGAKFRSEDDDGPRIVADVERLMGESRAIRKLEAYWLLIKDWGHGAG